MKLSGSFGRLSLTKTAKSVIRGEGPSLTSPTPVSIAGMAWVRATRGTRSPVEKETMTLSGYLPLKKQSGQFLQILQATRWFFRYVGTKTLLTPIKIRIFAHELPNLP